MARFFSNVTLLLVIGVMTLTPMLLHGVGVSRNGTEAAEYGIKTSRNGSEGAGFGVEATRSEVVKVEPVDKVNLFIGTTNYGTTNPGPVMPNGMMSVSPLQRDGFTEEPVRQG